MVPVWLIVLTFDHNPTNTDMGSQSNIQCKNLQVHVRSNDLYFYQSVRLNVCAPMKSGTNVAYKCLHPMKSDSKCHL